ncbi:hypothetical protein [Shewanella putrefaciens]|uniref:hypothetical protein n=1 Tax=Shewanella TaxID=22 RepID=UPI002859589F|nr:hypothetical protein [Shewanella putrefaciens]MDR6963979.1 hypothetical protein [Shewanella putrefaciens]
MVCPDYVAEHLLNIIERGVINSRYFSENNDIKKVFIETNHIHNLPSLMKNFSVKLLEHYLTVEAEEYKRCMTSSSVAVLEEDWEGLKNYLKMHKG